MIKIDTSIFSKFEPARIWENGISTLDRLIHSPWVKWSVVAGASIAAIAIARVQSRLNPLDKKLASKPDAIKLLELYQELIPYRTHWFYSKRWAALKEHLDDDALCKTFCQKLLEHQINNLQQDWLSPVSELICLERLCEFEDIDIKQIKIQAKDLAEALEKPPEEEETVRGFVGSYTAPVVTYINQALHSFASTFLRAHDFSADDNNSLIQRPEAMYRLQSFYDVIEKPAFLLIALFSYLKSKTDYRWIPYAVTLSTIMAATLAIRFFYSYNKKEEPVLSHDFRNLSEEAKQRILPRAFCSAEHLATMAACFSPLDRNSLSILLVGPPGVGKDALVNAFVWGIENGDFPLLKGVQVHTTTTSELKEFGGGTGHVYLSRLQILLRDLRGKEHQNIIFANEIHTLNPKKGQANTDHTELGQQFKRYIETGRLHVIGATTLQEYQDHIAWDKALNRRFVKIFLGTSQNEECLEILELVMADEYPTVPFDKDALQLALEGTNKIDPDVSQPSKAKLLLARAARSVIANHGNEEKDFVKLSTQLEKERHVLKRDPTQAQKANEVAKQASEVKDKKDSIAKKRKELEGLGNLKQSRMRYQERLVQWAHRVSQLPEKSTAGLEKFLMIQKFLTHLNLTITAKEKELQGKGIRCNVDKTLIEELLKTPSSLAE